MKLPVAGRSAEMPAANRFTDGPMAVAPMMDFTNRFLRYMLRRITKRSTLYTEMVNCNSIVHCPPSELPRFLEYDRDSEHPVVLQLGGSDPKTLRRACAISREWGYDAINLNCGCPSDRVAGSGCFGAALMRDPVLTAEICEAMAEGANGVPITVKCRIGVADTAAEALAAEPEELFDSLSNFVETVSSRGGVRHFAVHARQAVLGGLSPDQNRKVPPLNYDVVHRLAVARPDLSFSLNGGVEWPQEAFSLCDGLAAASWVWGKPEGHGRTSDDTTAGGGHISGVMVGRAFVNRPWSWATVDSSLYGTPDPAVNRRALLHDYAMYAERMEATHPQRIRRLLLAPTLNLFASEPNGKKFRAALDTRVKDESLSLPNLLLGTAADTLLPETLDVAPGLVWHKHSRTYTTPEEAKEAGGAALVASTGSRTLQSPQE